jgi:HK97 family phage major capsid protein
MTTLSQRILALQTERGQMVRAYEATLQPALDDNRDLNDTETATIGEARSRLDTIDVQLRHLSDAEAAFQRSALPAGGGLPGNRPGTAMVLATQRSHPVIQMQRRDAFKGQDFVRMAIAISVAGFWNAAEYARMRWADDELSEIIQHSVAIQFRAVVPPMATDDTQGGSLITRFEYLASEFIEMLRPMLIVGRMPSMRRLSFNNNGTLLIPKQTGGVAGGYVGEGRAIAVNRLIFERMTLTPSKLAVIVPQTQELLRRSDPPTEMLIRDDMLEGTARTIDSFFFSTRVAAANPAGILESIPPLVAGMIPPATGIGGGDVTAVTVALRAMLWELRRQNVPMNAPVWIMNARTKEYLRLLRTVQEIFAFKAEIDAGTLLGYPIIDTTAIPIPFPPGTGEQTAYALIDASQLIWADDMAPIIDASQEASVQLDDLPQQPPNPGSIPAIYSAFQNDMVFMRLRMSHSWARRHDVAVVWALADDAG